MVGRNTDVSALAKSFRKEFATHKRNMAIKRKIAVFEEYRKLLEDYKYQIRSMNEQIEQQTTGAALQAGFVRMGDVFVKKVDGLRTTGVVNKYQWFDTDYWFDHYLKQAGVDKKLADGDTDPSDMVNFLKNASDVEVEAYFQKQKLAVQYASKKIMGSARTEGERRAARASRDKNALGDFAFWAGWDALPSSVAAGKALPSLLRSDQGAPERVAVEARRPCRARRSSMPSTHSRITCRPTLSWEGLPDSSSRA